MSKERLQKILAGAGVSSRRAAETMIVAGRVRVNGVIVSQLGAKADARKDKVELDGRRLVLERPVYYMLHKPRGMVTTLHDPEGRAAVGELLRQIPERVVPVGRLDFHTSGALLLTNDGDLIDALLHPARKVPKTYVAKVKGAVNEGTLERLRSGVQLDDGYTTGESEVFVIREDPTATWIELTLFEGKNRQIHRMCEAVGLRVMRLARLSFAGVTTEGLRPGELRPLTITESEKVRKTYLVAKRQSATKARGRARPNAGPSVVDAIEQGDARNDTRERGGERGAERGAERGRGWGGPPSERRDVRPGGRSGARSDTRGRGPGGPGSGGRRDSRPDSRQDARPDTRPDTRGRGRDGGPVRSASDTRPSRAGAANRARGQPDRGRGRPSRRR